MISNGASDVYQYVSPAKFLVALMNRCDRRAALGLYHFGAEFDIRYHCSDEPLESFRGLDFSFVELLTRR